MNDSDIFHQLQFGTRFSKKHEELKSKEKKKESRVEESEPASTDFTLPPQLDFFGTQKRKNKATETTQTNPPTKKRKISHTDDPSDPSDHSDHSDEEKNAEIPSCLVAPKATDHKSYQKLRKQHRIQVDQANLPLLTSFDELTTRYNAKQYIVKNITEELSFSTPTPIQMQAIPALVEGNEVVACAPTGSGKTAAFAIPMLMALKNPSKGNHRALILSPTRELAMQTYQQVKRLSKDKAFRICLLTKATTPMETESNTRRFDIIVSTPLRLVRLIQDNSIKLDTIEYLVMDEADQLFELGFLSQIDEIIAACSNKTVLRCLFSATMPPSVEQMAKSFLRNPVRIVIGAKNSAASTLQQRLVYCGQEEGKILALRQLIEEGIDPPVIIFVQSKDRAMELYHELIYDNINADVITSDRTKAQRDKTVKQFRTGNIWVLIATDLMARGMDFRGVNLVVNYDIPPTATQYIHRIGRAGRAGRAGKAVSFYTKDDLTILRSIVSVMRASGMAMPDWMSLLPKPSKKDKRTTPQRDSISNAPSKNKRRKKKKRSKSKKNQDQQDTTEPAEETSN